MLVHIMWTWGYSPFLEIEEDLPQPTSSTDHVQVNGSKEGEVDLNYILSRNDNEQ